VTTMVSALPRLKWLNARLAELAPTAEPELVAEHAGAIFCAVMDIVSRGEPDNNRRRVKARSTKTSPKNWLHKLSASARRAINDRARRPEWGRSWADSPEPTRRLLLWNACESVDADRISSFDGGEGGSSHIFPWPEDALPLIKQAIAELQEAPGPARKERKPNSLDSELAGAILAAFRALAVAAPQHVQQRSLSLLARDISNHFKLSIFHPNGRKLRKLQAALSVLPEKYFD
jgi:hypothetical protein